MDNNNFYDIITYRCHVYWLLNVIYTDNSECCTDKLYDKHGEFQPIKITGEDNDCYLQLTPCNLFYLKYKLKEIYFQFQECLVLTKKNCEIIYKKENTPC